MDTPIMDTQVGGDHYTKMTIQPIEYIFANDIGFAEGSIIKYVSRYRNKGGVKDLKKARHLMDLLIEKVENEALKEVNLDTISDSPGDLMPTKT